MSTTEIKEQTIEENETKSARETKRCEKSWKNPRAIACLKSKIPMNIFHASRSQTTTNPNENSTPIGASTSLDEASIVETPTTSARRLSRSQSPTKIPSRLDTPRANRSPKPLGSSSKQNLEKSNLPKAKRRFLSAKRETTEKQQKNVAQTYEGASSPNNKTPHQSRKPGETETLNLSSPLTNNFVAKISTNLQKLLSTYETVCREMLSERSELQEFLEKLKEGKDDIDAKEETKKLLESLRSKFFLNSDPESRVEEAKRCGVAFVNDIKEEMINLRKELETSREKIRELESVDERRQKEKKSLENEHAQLRERQSALEAEIQKLRIEERQANAEKTKLQSQESQMRQKKLGIEKQLRDMEKSLKNSQSLLAKTEKQRDSFEARLIDLKKNLAAKEKENETKIKSMTDKLNAINSELAKEREKQNRKLGSEETPITELHLKLIERDNKIEILRRQKEEIIRVADSSFFEDQNDAKLDDDSETHDAIINLLAKKMQEFHVQYKILEEKNENLYQQLTETKSRGFEQLKNNEKSCWAERVAVLDKQVKELRANVRELTNRNEELEIALNQKQLEIEEQDRVIRERSDVLKVRDEVLSLISQSDSPEGGFLGLKKKNQRKSKEQVDKQMAKNAENLQQLYSTLETKQMQITRLEQLVEQMEIQQERAQEQRTRLEKKIAQLQMAIHYKKSHRSRGWLSIL